MTFISYSQNFEDLMLWRALKHIKNGFYVDIGANDPKHLSVTKAFYDQGWHGINIDPITYSLLSRERLRDINLNIAVSNAPGEINFFEVSDSALCTSDPQLAQTYREMGKVVIERKVPTLTLNQVLKEHSQVPIHFMNIDVEGAELQVLQGLDLSLWRPWILLIEATIPTTTTPSFDTWEPLIVSAEYNFAYFDGLNRFYVSKEHSELMDLFHLPPGIFDEFTLSREIDKQDELVAKENVIQAQNKELLVREQIIQKYQGSFYFWVTNGPLLIYIRPILNLIKGFFRRNPS
ncbi:MAG: FkbM family methyltransferase [Anaerolineales bacterium]|nr:FkbM family methyltransferase [Anaerolineales bacterium]